MATSVDTEWRKKEESFEEIVKKYPTVSPFIILQIDVQRRGIFYTNEALKRIDPKIHKLNKHLDSNGQERVTPASILLRDGTSIITGENHTKTSRDPYIVDVIDNKTVLTDEDNIIEEVEYWEKPQFDDKFTSRGTPMSEVVGSRPQRYSVSLSKYCHFWSKPGQGCKYCGIGSNGVKFRGHENERVNLQDLEETMRELVKEKGRFTGVILTGGSILSGNKLCDDELNGYIDALKAIGTVFDTPKFPSQVNSTAFDEKQLIRLYEETGLTI